MLKRIAGIVSFALLPLTAGATTFIVPAAGTGPGAGGSHWSSDLVFHNASSATADIDLVYHDASGASKPQSFVIGPRTTVTSNDVVRNIFGLQSGTGAVEIIVPDAQGSRLVVTSRTFNTSSNGIFGQDIPAVNVNDAAALGDLTVLAGPTFANDFRFNFGIYAPEATSVTWELVRAGGTIAATKEVAYAAGTQFQYNNGVETFLGAPPSDGDVVYATVTKGKAIVYGSVVNNGSGDPTYVPGIHARADSHIAFGVDVNEDGTIELNDADNDGVLDKPINLYTIGFPNYFRVVFPGHSDVKVELAEPAPDVLLLDDKGSIEWAPSAADHGATRTLRLKVTSGGVTEIISIPAVIR